jgi:hypothetical protein
MASCINSSTLDQLRVLPGAVGLVVEAVSRLDALYTTGR